MSEPLSSNPSNEFSEGLRRRISQPGQGDLWLEACACEIERLTEDNERLSERLASQIDENDALRGVNTFWGGKTEKERECDRLKAEIERLTRELAESREQAVNQTMINCEFAAAHLKMRAALVEAVGWNWLDEDAEHTIPERVWKQCHDALGATDEAKSVRCWSCGEPGPMPPGYHKDHMDMWAICACDGCKAIRDAVNGDGCR